MPGKTKRICVAQQAVSKSLDRHSTDLVDDIFYDLVRANDRRLKNTWKHDADKIFNIQRSTLFPTHYTTVMMHNFCKSYQFNRTIECFAIELFDRIMDKLFYRYSCFQSDPMVYQQMNELVNFNVCNSVILFNSILCSLLFYRFFVDLKNQDLRNLIEPVFKNSNEFLEKSFNLLCIVCVFLAQKLHGDRRCKYSIAHCVKLEERRRTFGLEFAIIKYHYPLIESKLLELLKFDLHIDTLDNYIDCLLSLIQRKLSPIALAQLNSAIRDYLRSLLAQFYRHRVALLKSVIHESNNRPFGSEISDSLQLESMCLNKMLQSSSLILACCLFIPRTLNHANLSQYVLHLLVFITRLPSRTILIFAQHLRNVQFNHHL